MTWGSRFLAERVPRAILVFGLGLVISAGLALDPPSVFADKTYTLDEDPIRLGNKALVQGRLVDAKTHYNEAIANEYKIHEALFGLGEVAVGEGRYADAEPLYRRTVEEQAAEGKEYPEARAGLGLLLVRLGRYQEAGMEFEKALDEESDLWAAQYGQARLSLQEERWEEARKRLQKGASRKGAKEGEDQYHYGMALYHLSREDLDEAEKEALLALSLKPSDPEYGALVGRVYEKRNAPTLAIGAYEKAMASPGMTPTAAMLHALGGLYEKVDDYNTARDRYLEAVRIDSTYAPALRDLATLYRRANRHDQAARILLRYVLLEPNDLEALLGLNESCMEVRQYGQALEAARAALALDSTRVDVRMAYARAGIQSRDLSVKAEAASIYATVPATASWTAQDHVALATFQIETGQYDRAGEHLAAAREIDPDNAEIHFQLGILALKTGRHQEAVGHLEKAVELDPDAPLAQLNLGIAYFGAKKFASAVSPFRRTLELRPELTVARLLLAQALAVSGSVAEARVEYEKVLEAEPDNAKALRGLAYCHIKNAEYALAAAAYARSVQADPANADGWAGLGNARLGLKEYDEAAVAFEKAGELDPNNATMRKGLELLQKAQEGAGGS